MHTIRSIAAYLEHIAPLRLAEEWDNVGLLVGRGDCEVRRVMTCLTVTPASAAEAVEQHADLIITHHPLPFRPVGRITDENTVGRLLLDLIEANVAVYSAHTAFDSAAHGINERLAVGLQLRGVAPMLPHAEGQGTGRWGTLEQSMPLDDLARRLKSFLAVERLQIVGEPQQEIRTVGIACGAADELLDAARQNGCDALVIGEARFHTCLEAQAAGVALLMPGHYASERFAIACLAEALAVQFPDIKIWASHQETDPLRWT